VVTTFLDDIFVPITTDLLGSLGKAVTLTNVAAGAYDPTTGQAGSGSSSGATVHAIVEDFRGIELAGGLVQIGDKKVSIAGGELASAPSPDGDTVTIDGQAFKIVAVNAIYSGESVALWVLTCRRG
jgi:hypothetical protein